MSTYQYYAELARMCWRQALLARSEGLARAFRQMARECQLEAAKRDGREPANLDKIYDESGWF